MASISGVKKIFYEQLLNSWTGGIDNGDDARRTAESAVNLFHVTARYGSVPNHVENKKTVLTPHKAIILQLYGRITHGRLQHGLSFVTFQFGQIMRTVFVRDLRWNQRCKCRVERSHK